MAAVKQVEGMIYFDVLAPAIADAGLRNAIALEWKKAPKSIDAEMIRDNLSRALPEVWKDLPDSTKTF